MGRRITRKQLKQDEFISTADTLVSWVVDNWRPFVFGLAALCVVIMLWWVGSRWTSSRAESASYLLHQAAPAVDEALSGGDPTAAEEQLGEVIDRYGRTEQADMARIYLARLALAKDDRDRALSLLREVAERRGSDAIGSVATLDLVQLRISAGEGAEVAPQLEAVVAGEDASLPRDVALWELAELYAGDDAERARGYLQRIVDEFPESPYRARASQRLSELG